jgi:pimeloyl-ACP methyl ester carboxylesterase
VVELLDLLGVRDFSLVGHDWGGPVAFAATLLARDRVKKLALVDAVLAGDGRSAGSGQGGALAPPLSSDATSPRSAHGRA